MTLTQAKAIADNCASNSNRNLWSAYRILLVMEKRANKPAPELDKRIAALEDEIKRRKMTAVPRLSALFPF